LPLETLFSVFGVDEGEVESAKKLFISQYGFSEYQSSELEADVISVVLVQLEGKEEIILSPKEIVNVMEWPIDDYSSSLQRATKVGNAIKSFNLAEKKVRSNKGMRYMFIRTHVQKVYERYLSPTEEIKHTQPTPEKEEVDTTTLI